MAQARTSLTALVIIAVLGSPAFAADREQWCIDWLSAGLPPQNEVGEINASFGVDSAGGVWVAWVDGCNLRVWRLDRTAKVPSRA